MVKEMRIAQSKSHPYDNACLHRVQLIQTLLKDFCWEEFEHSVLTGLDAE